jgi:hypothetical protein
MFFNFGKMKKIYVTLAGMVLIALACNKDFNTSNDEIVVTSGVNCNPQNLNHQNVNHSYDYVGQWHNAALDHAAGLVNVMTATDQELFDAIKDFFIEMEISVEADLDLYPPDYFDSLDVRQGMTFGYYLDKYVGNKQNDYTRILRELDTLVFMTPYSDEQALLDAIKAYEANFLLTETQENIEFHMPGISILRHSIEYWTEARENPCHAWYEVVNQGISIPKVDPMWLARFAIDVLSYNNCMSGPFGSEAAYNSAQTRCLSSAAYSSARAFECGMWCWP